MSRWHIIMLVQARAAAVVRLKQGDQGESAQHSPMSTRVSLRNTEELHPSEEVAVLEAFMEAEEGPLADIRIAHLSNEFLETEEWQLRIQQCRHSAFSTHSLLVNECKLLNTACCM